MSVSYATLRVSWSDCDEIAAAIERRLAKRIRIGASTYHHPIELQAQTPPEFQRNFAVPVSTVESGPLEAPVVLCVGGVANTARRFDFLAEMLADRYHVIAMDWVGRGASGWLADETDYSFETDVESLAQFIAARGLRNVHAIGSSLGGAVVLALADRDPGAFASIVLNDIGPYLPRERRIRRAATLARHYVFRSPDELLRRVGASQKHDGPLHPDIVLHNCYHLTRWSDEEGGRVYRHDLRALQAYRRQAQNDLECWDVWEALRVPVLVLHGQESDALLPQTLARMRERPHTTVAHIAQTGHSPALAEPNETALIRRWLDDSSAIADDTVIVPAAPGSYSVR